MKINNLYTGNIYNVDCNGWIIARTNSSGTFHHVIVANTIKESLFYRIGNRVFDLLDHNKSYKLKSSDECKKIRFISKKFVKDCKYVGDEISQEKRLPKRKILSIYNKKKKEK